MVHAIKNTDLLIYNTLNKMKKLELIDINKSYDTNVTVLKNVSFSVENGEFLVLLGPSGCGKSTILSIIAGFEKQNDGNVIIDGRNCDTVSCQNRDIAMVFQSRGDSKKCHRPALLFRKGNFHDRPDSLSRIYPAQLWYAVSV